MTLQVPQVCGKMASGVQGVGIVFAQHPTQTDPGIFLKPVCLPMTSQRPQICGEVARTEQGVTVILAQHLAHELVGTTPEIEGILEKW